MLTIDDLLGASKVNGLDATDLLLHRASQSRTRDGSGRPGRGAKGRDESAPLDGRLGQLAGHRPHGVGETSGRHVGWAWRETGCRKVEDRKTG